MKKIKTMKIIQICSIFWLAITAICLWKGVSVYATPPIEDKYPTIIDRTYTAEEYETTPQESFKCREDGTCPELGIIHIDDNGSWLHVTTDTEKEPYRLDDPPKGPNPIIEFKNRNFQISELQGTLGLTEDQKGTVVIGFFGVPTGGWCILGILWIYHYKKKGSE